MTCAKLRVVCDIITQQGTARGTNDVNRPQAVCPREPGEGYEKCASICDQPGHAETEAILAAKANGWDLRGAAVYLYGHNYVCPSCGSALAAENVAVICVYSNRLPPPLPGNV
jgi:deoxycytidylate deaminase